MPQLFKLFGSIEKVEEQADGTVMVYGIASSGARDGADEIVSPDAMKAALPDYSKFPALREMHQPLAAGRVAEAEVDEDGITHIAAHVVDPTAVLKVKTKVYGGFSIGGKVTKRDSADRSIITGLKLVEISLVDSPCNPDAVLTMWKADTMKEFKPEAADVIARAKILAKAAGTQRFKDFLFEAGQELISEHLIEKGELEPPADEPEALEPEAIEPDAVVEEPAKEAAAEAEVVVITDPGQAGAAMAEIVGGEHRPNKAPVEGKEAAAEPGDQADPGDEDAGAGDAEEGDEAKTASENPDLVAALEDAIAKGEAVIESSAAPEADAPADPFADTGKAAAALKGISIPDASGSIEKCLWDVSRFADLLQSLASLQRSAAWEAEDEGDGSPIPAQLADAVKNLGGILIAMAQEEIAELVAGLKVADGEPEVVIIYSGDECLLAESIVDLVKADAGLIEAAAERLAKTAPPVTEAAPTEGADEELAAKDAEIERLSKVVAEAAPAVEKLVEGFTGTIDVLKSEVADLRKRFDDEPLPPKTAGPLAGRVISKAVDSGGNGAEPELQMTPEQFDKAWAGLSEAERGNILIKAALANPQRIALPGGRS